MGKKKKASKEVLLSGEILRIAKLARICHYSNYANKPFIIVFALMVVLYLLNVQVPGDIAYVAVVLSLVSMFIGDLVKLYAFRKDQLMEHPDGLLKHEIFNNYAKINYKNIRVRICTTVFEILAYTFFFKMNVGLAQMASVMSISYIITMSIVGYKNYYYFKYIHCNIREMDEEGKDLLKNKNKSEA